MSQERPLTNRQAAPRQQPSSTFGQIGGPVLNVIGWPELIGLAGAALLAVIVVFAYLYFYLPANSRLTSIQLERTTLQSRLQAARAQYQENDTTSQTIARINASLEDFQANWLTAQSPGRMSLYTVLNNLIKSNGLRNTAGPSYSELDVIGTKTQVQPGITAEKQSTGKWQSIYPGVAVSVTVEGPYQSVRHFVRDIETSRQFLIINAVELEGVRGSGTMQDQPLPTTSTVTKNKNSGSKGSDIAGGRGGFVSLRLDLATYFQRPEAKQPPTN
ncbi:MAG TPA: GspMb/PilO family protein [Pyrinomonadaceae bacterium]|jgi:Tfp pilus assembly protein PilO|nr:GspMb/PilO family protein [Pyrinomonadaceae bacterium]